MLTTTTRKIFSKSSKGTYIAHVIRVPIEGSSKTHTYFTGLSDVNGQPLGMITSHTGDVLRQWKHVAAIEDYLAVLGDRLAGILIYPAQNPAEEVTAMLIRQYQMDKPNPDATLETERETFLAALQRRSPDGRASDTPDP